MFTFLFELATLKSCGCALSAEELYKVDKTAMGDILALKVGSKNELDLTEEDEMDEIISTTNISSPDKERELTVELKEIIQTYSQSKPETSECVDQDIMPVTNGKCVKTGMYIRE